MEILIDSIFCQVFRLVNNQRKQLQQGILKIFKNQATRKYLLIVDDYQLELKADSLFAFSLYPDKTYGILIQYNQNNTSLEGFICMVLDTDQESVEKLKKVINEIGLLLFQNEFQDNIGLSMEIQKHCKDFFEVPFTQDYQENKLAMCILKCSQCLRKNCELLAEKSVKCMQKCENCMSSKIEKTRLINVSDSHKQKVSNLKQKCEGCGKKISQCLEKICLYPSKCLNYVLQKTFQGLQQSNNKCCLFLRQVCSATHTFLSNLYNGTKNFASKCCCSCLDTTRSVFEKKYGTEITESYFGESLHKNNAIQIIANNNKDKNNDNTSSIKTQQHESSLQQIQLETNLGQDQNIDNEIQQQQQQVGKLDFKYPSFE